MINEDYNFLVNALSGKQITEICLDVWQTVIQLGDAYILLECDWDLLDNSGNSIDKSIEFIQRIKFDLWRVIGLHVKSVSLIDLPSSSFCLLLDNDFKINIFSNDDGYEDWNVHSPEFGTLICICNEKMA